MGLSDGALKSLIDLRDDVLPRLVDQLDQLAYTIVDEINQVHNLGTSFPPPSSLTGVTPVTDTDSFGFSGSVMIAVVDQTGVPITSPYSDEQYYRPLTLDLSSLDSGDGAGEPTMQTIIDEINDYYGPPQNRAAVGNLRDISIAAVSNSITDNGTGVEFDLQLDNTSYQDSTVVINSITLVGETGFTAATLPSPNSYEVNAGDRERTNIPFTVNFDSDINQTSYTVRLQVEVTAADGTVSTANIDYTVEDNVTGVKNDRYYADAVSLVSSTGSASFIEAPSSTRFATASLVDANGNAVSSGTSGFLKIEVESGQSYGLAIDSLDSQEIGVSTAATSSITNRGFSHYFEMNNLFIENSTTAGSAVNMAVRTDIITNPSKLALGTLTLSNQPISATEALYTYELGSGNSANVQSLAALAQTNVSFGAAGALPSTSTTISSYGIDIVSYTATITNSALEAADLEALGFEGLQELFQEESGVNVDKELADLIKFENNYNASARIISVVSGLFDSLINAFR